MEQENITYCGTIGIVGRPNVGKSSLLNALLGQKIAIISRKAQTTRHRILGIVTEDDCQYIFVDSPGIHAQEKRVMNKVLNKTASNVINDVNLIFFQVEAFSWNEDDALVLEKLKETKTPVILLINKIDLLKDKAQLLPYLEKMESIYPFKDMVPISAEKNINLDSLLKIAKEYLPQQPFVFPEDYVTDKGARFIISELIREKVIRFTGDELPYTSTIEIEQYRELANGSLEVHAAILVERIGQKKMIIGAGGEKIKTIGTLARKELEEILERKIHLNLWVKVKKGWSDNLRAIQSLGYNND